MERPIIGELKKAKLATAKGLKNLGLPRRTRFRNWKELRLFFLRASSLILQVTIGKDSQVLLRGTISACNATHGNSLSHRVAGSIGNAKLQVGFSKGKKWRVKWEIKKEPCRN